MYLTLKFKNKSSVFNELPTDVEVPSMYRYAGRGILDF